MVEGNNRICVRVNRRVALAATALFGFALVGGISRAVTAHNTESAILILIVIGIPFAFYVRRSLRRAPVLILDKECLRDVRSGKIVRWDKLGDLHLLQRRGVFGEYHSLIFTDRSTQDNLMKLSLDQLSVGWKDIVGIIEERVGRGVPVRREAGVRIRRDST